VKPVLQALVLADRIYSDAGSGKKVIAGTFSKLIVINRETKPEKDVPSVLEIPAGGMQAGSPFAYVSVTDIKREAKLILRYIHLKDAEHEVIFQTELLAKCDDPLLTVEIVVPLPTLPPIKGVFAFEVLCDDELLGSHRVIVEERQE
jgi:hypothetical protein